MLIVKFAIIFIVCLTIAVPVVTTIGIHNEKRSYNEGNCPHCRDTSRRLEFFSADSQGGRGYICPHCKYTTWVSYLCVDGTNRIFGRINYGE